jgi:hypothetical protein
MLSQELVFVASKVLLICHRSLIRTYTDDMRIGMLYTGTLLSRDLGLA